MIELERTVKLAPYGFKDGKPALPNPTQEKILDWIDNIRQKDNALQDGQQIPTLYLSGGAGSGKTRGFLAPVMEMLCEIPGIKILWCRQDYNDLRLSAMQTFEETMPRDLIAGQSVQEHWTDIRQEKKDKDGHHTKGRLFFSGAKDVSGKGSQEFAVIVITEVYEISEQTFRTLKLRCRQAGMPTMILMEGNPPNEMHWLERMTNPKDTMFDDSITKWELSTYENWENLPIAYRNSLEQMPMAWKTKYLFGKAGFMPEGTPFYVGFNEELNTCEVEWAEGEQLLIGFDYGWRHPACVISKLDAMGRWCKMREFIGTEILIESFAVQCKTKLNIYYPNFKGQVYGDPAGEQQSDKSKEVSAAIVARIFGVPRVISRPSNETGANYEARKLIIEGKLQRLINGAPEILVDKRYCRHTIDGYIGGYHYPKRDVNKPVRGNEDAPERDGFYEHIMNAWEYIAVNIFEPLQVHTNKVTIPRRKPRRMDNV